MLTPCPTAGLLDSAPRPQLPGHVEERRPRGLPLLLLIAVLALAYFLTARTLIALSAPPNGAVLTIWLPSGISVAALVLFGPAVAIGAYIGALAFELAANTPLPAALLVAFANAGCELLCYYLVAQVGLRRFSISTVPEVARAAVAAALAAAASASVGVSTYVAFGIVPAGEYWPTWMTWFGSVVVGIVLIAPFLVQCALAGRALLARFRNPEFSAVILAVVLSAYLWQGPVLPREHVEPVLLVIILALLWLAFRFHVTAMTAAVFSFAVASVVGAVVRVGSGPPATAYVSIFSLQLMLAGIGIIGYVLTLTVAQQRRSSRALSEAQSQAVANARQAGMAEIATNVLHNVGNVLNSVNVSAGVVSERLKTSKSRGLSNAVRLMNEHTEDLSSFLTRDPKGQLLPTYLARVAESLEEEQQALAEELSRLTRNVDHIKEIVSTQQSYAGVSTVLEPVRMTDLVEDALRINGHVVTRQHVQVIRQFGDTPPVPLDRARLMQILVNLISNALHAMAPVTDRPRRLTLAVEFAQQRMRVRVIDDGEGIAPENLTRIFSHGFTTRKGGHGFGLHSCALAARDMGGTLTVHSEGRGCGASFTLEVPVTAAA